MRLLYSSDDATKIGGPGPIVHVDPTAHAVKVATVKAQTTSAPSSAAIITAAADIVLAAGDVLRIQNLGTNPLFVKRGAGASTSSVHHILQAGVANDDGKGGALVIDDFTGTVSFAGTGVRYLAWK